MNTLVNADYYGRQGIVIQKYPDKFVFENPGSFRIPLKDAFDGGTSDLRNATILKMFSMIDIGERAGSGIPWIVSVWEENFKSKPVYIQTSNPSRVKTELDISDFVQSDEVSSDKSNQKQEEVEKDLLAILADKQEHAVSELAKIVGLSPARTRAIVADLVSKGKLTAKGSNKNRTYSLK